MRSIIKVRLKRIALDLCLLYSLFNYLPTLIIQQLFVTLVENLILKRRLRDYWALSIKLRLSSPLNHHKNVILGLLEGNLLLILRWTLLIIN